MEFRCRFVPFATRFETVSQYRVGETDFAPSFLGLNEIAADVGGRCFDSNGEMGLVFDHHFAGEERPLPSASAAVLRHARAIHDALNERMEQAPEEAKHVWIVTHDSPDFDALCALFLIQHIVDQSSADWLVPLDGWEGPGPSEKSNEFQDWFNPEATPDRTRRWPRLLAVYASWVDNARALHCSRSEALHSVLYATFKRRGNSFWRGGAQALFRAAATAIRDQGLNPVFDCLFDTESEFAPELALLARERDAYERDIRRAYKCIVRLPRTRVDFQQFFQMVEGKEYAPPLLETEGDGTRPRICEAHLAVLRDPTRNDHIQADGVFLRDPECLLFKEWARQDLENSQLGRGFFFTAIAYSGHCPSAVLNTTDYFFALDSEKADGAHLYEIWARLQCEEARSLLARDLEQPDKPPRNTFQRRASGFEACFADPWFDGQNYQATIIGTPWQGTFIGPPGQRADLRDDPIAQIALQEVEHTLFERTQGETGPSARVTDFPLMESVQVHFNDARVPLFQAIEVPLRRDCFRFVDAQLAPDLDLSLPGVGRQVSACLWPYLEVTGASAFPVEVEKDRICVQKDFIALWNLKGIGIAAKPSARPLAEQLYRDLRNMSQVSCRLRQLVDSPTEKSGTSLISQGEELLRQITLLKLERARPEKQVLAQLMDAVRFDEIARSVHELNSVAIEREDEKRAEEEEARSSALERWFTILAFAVGVPGLLLSFFQVIDFDNLASAKPGWFLQMVTFDRIWDNWWTKGWAQTLISTLLFLLAAFALASVISRRRAARSARRDPP